MQFIQDFLLNYWTNQKNNGSNPANNRVETYNKYGYTADDIPTELPKNAIYAIGHYFNLATSEISQMLGWTYSKLSGYINSFLDKKVMWVVHSDTACAYCTALNNKVFKIRNIPPKHPNCRCGLVAVEDNTPESFQYPGNDPLAKPEGDYIWKGRGDVLSRQGMWVNDETSVALREDLNHPLPIGPHWDQWDKDKNRFRVYEDGRVEYVEK